MVVAVAAGASGQKRQEPGRGWDTRLSLRSPVPLLVFPENISQSTVVVQGHRSPAQLAGCVLDSVGQKDPNNSWPASSVPPAQKCMHKSRNVIREVAGVRDTLRA